MTVLLAILVFSAGVLCVLVSMTPAVQAQAGYLHGGVYWTDQYGNMHPMSWAQVVAEGSESTTVANAINGSYEMWLPAGTYTVTASSDPGFYPQSANVVVSPGSSASQDFYLKPTGKPIPELPPWTPPFIILATLMITAIAVRRQKTSTRN
jgi:hypothetical protein